MAETSSLLRNHTYYGYRGFESLRLRHHLLILKEYFGNLYDFPLSTPYKLNAVERFGKMLGMVGLASIGNALY